MTISQLFDSYYKSLIPVPERCHVTQIQRQFLAHVDFEWKTMREIAADSGITYDQARNTFDRLKSKVGIDVKIISGDKPRLYRRNQFFEQVYGQV